MNRSFLLVIIICCVSILSAQDSYFMNVNQSLLALNPSYAGSNGGFRNQISHSFSDNGTNVRNNRKAVDLKLHSLNSGLGFVINQTNNGGLSNSLELGGIFAKYFSLYGGTHTVVPSVKVSFLTRTVFSSGGFGGSFGQTVAHADLSAGFLFNYSREFDFGLYWYHFNEPGENTLAGQVLSRYLFHMSYTIEMSKKDLVQVFYRSEIQSTKVRSQVLVHFLFARNLIVNMGLDAKGNACGGLGVKTGVFSVLVGYDAALPDYGYIVSTNGRQNGNWEIHAGLLISNKTTRGTLQPFDKM